jgi:hypothetical protein
MTDERDPEATLAEWEDTMQAEHADAIENPDPGETHRIEGVAQVTYRVTYEHDPETDDLTRAGEEKTSELADPELRSCSCGVRGMTPEEAREHVRAAHDARE